jgi:hypothetical protein
MHVQIAGERGIVSYKLPERDEGGNQQHEWIYSRRAYSRES